MTAYSPPGYSQIDGSRFQQQNCVAATCTDLIDRATVGRLRIGAPKIRTASGDFSGGLSYSTAATAVAKATGGQVQLDVRFGLDRNQTRDIVASGRAIGISIDCSVTRYTAYRTNYFTGGHTVYVNAYRVNASGHAEFMVEDPGTSSVGYLWWPADLLYRAAEKRGGGRINILAGRDTEAVKRKAIAAGTLRATPSTSGASKGAITVGYVYFVARTVNGGTWKRPDGSSSNGWHETTAGFIPGKGMA